MEMHMQSISNGSGVYQILCVPTGKVYVGSASNLRIRWREHRWTLNRGTHHSQYLQRAWNKYGETEFVFSVLELVPPELLLEAEQQWINATHCYERDCGFNICPTAGSVLGIKRSDATRQRMSEYTTIINLTKFCREHNLGSAHMWAVYKGIRVSHKGWTHINHLHRLQTIKYEGFISPEGDSAPPIENMKQFCQDNDLIPNHMYLVYHGKRRHHKGWTCVRTKDSLDE
jgi:group I intron endonuclease